MAFQNFFAAKLYADIGSSDTTITLDTAPTATSGRMVLEARNPTQREIISYSGVSGNQLTGVVRGITPTTAKSHLKNALIEMNVTAQDLQDLYDAFASFASTNTDWRTLPYTFSYVSHAGGREFNVSAPVDLTAIVPVGARFKWNRSGTTPTTSATFLSASSQYARRVTPGGYAFTDNFTVEALIKPRTTLGTNAAQTIVRKHGAPGNGFGFRLTTKNRLNLFVGNGGVYDEIETYESIDPSKWSRVTAKINLAGTAGQIYIDGQPVPTKYNNTAMTAMVQAGDLYIGANESSAEYFDGQISDVRIWSTYRTDTQVRDNAFNVLVGSETGLVGYYPLNGTWNDLTANANHLTSFGGAPVNNTVDHCYKATEYAIVHKVSYSAGVTTINLWTGTGNSMASNGSFSAVSYANVKTPIGFPIDKSNWVKNVFINESWQTGIGAVNSWTPATGNVGIIVPLGSWRIGYQGTFNQDSTAAANRSGFFTLANPTYAPAYFPTSGVTSPTKLITRSYDGNVGLTTKHVNGNRFEDFNLTTSQEQWILYGAIDAASGSESWGFRGDQNSMRVYFEDNYL